MLKRFKSSFLFAKSDRVEETGNTGSMSLGRDYLDSPPEKPLQPEIDGARSISATNALYLPTATASTSKTSSYSPTARHLQPPGHGVGDDGDGVLPVPRTPDCLNNTDLVGRKEEVSIRNEVKIKVDTLRLEPDQVDPRQYLVKFTFDATAPGSITIMFFAKESRFGELIATEEFSLKQITMHFHEGLGQMFSQPSGSGIDLSFYDETELTKYGCIEVYPLAVKAKTYCLDHQEPEGTPTHNCRITLSRFNRCEKGEYKVQVMKEIIWVEGNRLELQERYIIGSREVDLDDGDPERERVDAYQNPQIQLSSLADIRASTLVEPS